jgi:hypothetical protein
MGTSGFIRMSIPALLATAALVAAGPAGATAGAAAHASRPPNTAIGGGYAAITVGHATAKGTSAHLPLSCSGTPHVSCFVLVTMTSAGHGIVGGSTVSVPVGRSFKVRFPLYANGKRLLAAQHRLRVKITVQTSKFKRLATDRVTFRK